MKGEGGGVGGQHIPEHGCVLKGRGGRAMILKEIPPLCHRGGGAMTQCVNANAIQRTNLRCSAIVPLTRGVNNTVCIGQEGTLTPSHPNVTKRVFWQIYAPQMATFFRC